MEMLLVWLDTKTHRRQGRFTTTGPCGHSCCENPVHHLVFETGTRRYQKSWVTPAGLRKYKNKSNTAKGTLGSEHQGKLAFEETVSVLQVVSRAPLLHCKTDS